jgi:hypothetical protein
MPYITAKTNVAISKEKEIVLKKALGKAIESFPRKSETWLMIQFEDESRMWFQGSDEPAAMVEVKIFGRGSEDSYAKMTKIVCELFEKELGIPGGRVYVRYDECFLWGMDGKNF